MCTNPQTIRNRFVHTKHLRSEFGDVVEVPKHLYSHREYIDVPCGKCAECRSTYIESLYQRCYVESLSSYVYFITLTYDNDHIPSIKTPSGVLVYFSDYSHIASMFDRFRKNFDRQYRYLCVNEYGDTNKRPHFHILLFVAKYENDDKTTPFFIEQTIYNSLRKYFSVNVGTRKHPIYEPLFTFAYRYVNGVLYTNYFVKYIEPLQSSFVVASSEHSITISKSIRYLISYVNKGSRLEEFIESELSSLSDKSLLTKFRNLLSCRVRFSKGLGNGFYNGTKCEMHIISKRMSELDLVYKNIVDTYDMDLTDFIKMYPNLYYSLLDFVCLPPYQGYTDIVDFTTNCSERDLFYHFLLLHYEPTTFNNLYRQYFLHITPYISYFYRFLNPSKYVKNLVNSYEPIFSPAFQYIRKCVDTGIELRLPYLAFTDVSTQCFYSLCDYYKERCTTIEDFSNMLSSCGFKNYDDWLDHFVKYIKYINSKKADKAKGNRAMPTDFIQKNCISNNEIVNIYTYLYHK